MEQLKNDFISKYLAQGEDKFYKFLLLYALNKIILMKQDNYSGPSPEIELIELYEKFLLIYRREGNEDYFAVAKLFRKAAHKIYRTMFNKGLIKKNSKFLNLVK